MPRKLTSRICVICNRPFEGDARATVCFDPTCRKTRQKQFQQKSDAKRDAAHRRSAAPAPKLAEASKPVPPSVASAAPKMPWASSGICQAIATGLSSAPAQKLGVFYVVDFGGADGFKPFIPREDNQWRSTTAQKIAVIARLNASGKWELRPQEANLA